MKKIYIIFISIGVLFIVGFLALRVYLGVDTDTDKQPATQREGTTDNGDGERDKSILDLRPLFIAKLQNIVNKGSDGLYNLAIDSLSLDVLASEVALYNVKLTHNSDVLKKLDQRKKAPSDVFTVSFQSLKISNINLDDVITRKTIDLDVVRVKGPTIKVMHAKRSYNKTNDSLTLYQRIMKEATSITVNKILVEDGTLTLSKANKNTKPTTFHHVTLLFNDIKIDSTTQNSNERFLFAKNARFSFKDFVYKTKDGLYTLKAGNVDVLAPEGKLTATGLQMKSNYSKADFSSQVSSRQERYDIEVPKVVFTNVDWWQLANNEKFVADAININNSDISIYLNRSLPAKKSKVGNYPHQMLMKLKMPVNIKKINVDNLHLNYEEYNPNSKETGKLVFSNTDIEVTNVTNMPGFIKKNKHITIKANTSFLNKTPLYTTINLDLARQKEGTFSASVKLNKLDGTELNPVAKPLGLFAIDKGTINELKADVQGTNYNASGDVLLLYNNLKISLYEKESDEKGLDKKGIKGFLANTFVVKNDNPSSKGDEPRHPDANFERDEHAGFFNLIWKTVLVGTIKTIGADPKLAKPKK